MDKVSYANAVHSMMYTDKFILCTYSDHIIKSLCSGNVDFYLTWVEF